MKHTIQIRLYDFFRKVFHLPDENARELVEIIDNVVVDAHERRLDGLATKDFVREETSLLKKEINRLDVKIEQTKGELLKAIFWTGLVQFLAIVGAVIAIFNFMQHAS